MDRGGKSGSAGDGDEEDSTRTRTSRHPDQHGQPGSYLPESGTMDGGGKAGSASDGDEEEGTWAWASFLVSMWNLSHALKELGRYGEALSMLQACVQLQDRRLGPAHPSTVAATADLKAWQRLYPVG